jgi:hypothetical protein
MCGTIRMGRRERMKMKRWKNEKCCRAAHVDLMIPLQHSNVVLSLLSP